MIVVINGYWVVSIVLVILWIICYNLVETGKEPVVLGTVTYILTILWCCWLLIKLIFFIEPFIRVAF